MAPILLITAATLILAPLHAQAQSYRCVGKDGKKYYGSVIPRQCVGLPVEQLGPSGAVIQRIDPERELQERRQKEAEEAKKRESETAAKETARRNSALLATYTSAKDVEEARARALAGNHKAILQIEGRMENARKRQAAHAKELEAYKGKEKPAKLVEDMRNAEQDLQEQQAALAAKQKEIEVINAKFDDDKKRYVELTGRR
jgi:hypothetical protein